MIQIDLRNRQYLRELEDAAKKAAREVLNPFWIRAYNDLAHAANIIDAFWARCTVRENDSAPVFATEKE